MRRKVGTSLDTTLYRRIQEIARRQGRSTNAVIEDALTRFISSGAVRASAVEETKGTYEVPAELLPAVLDADIYGSD